MPGIVPGDKAMNKTDIMLPAPECTFSWWPQTCREVRIITCDKYEAGGRHRVPQTHRRGHGCILWPVETKRKQM